ncbi:hypothetical protein [Pelagibacterium lacus]|uniref:Porin n=1 Tax=Pelagibacterium lacus TaxID=2282655 RepID=A0A369W679_9HYPH|nr:hypothetical protein [Pelagibacterium lacus]RDE09375.1 hypothetical protein DVH29_06100 [Pelagibacterium lacus]
MIILNWGRIACLVLAATAAAPAAAGDLPVALESSFEAGWTSNAQDGPGGSGSAYVIDSHTLALTAGEGDAMLRAAFGIEQTRYLSLPALDDWLARARIEAGIGLGPDTRLRGRLDLFYEEQGNWAATGLEMLGTRSPLFTGKAGLRLEHRAGQALLGLSVGYEARRPGETRIEADLVPPLRTASHADLFSAGLDLAHPLGRHATLSGVVEWQAVVVEAAEQALYGRVPGQLWRIAGGIEIGDGSGTALALRGGADMLFAGLDGIAPIVLPYARAEMSLVLVPGLTLRGSLSAEADIGDPADLYADWRLRARAGLMVNPLDGLSLEAALSAQQRRSAALDVTIETEWGASAEAVYRLGPLSLSGKLAYRRVEGLAGPYDENRLGLRVAANL